MGKGAQRGRGRLSGIEQLPPEADAIIAKASAALRDRELTQIEIYQAFYAELERLRRDHHGELDFAIPSMSAFNRYSLKLATLTRRMEDTRAIAATISERFDAQSSDELTLIAAEAIKTLVFEILTDAGESGVDPQGAMALANALHKATQAQSVSTSRREKVQKEFAKDVEKAVDTVAKSKGMTAETAEAIKAQILGVRS